MFVARHVSDALSAICAFRHCSRSSPTAFPQLLCTTHIFALVFSVAVVLRQISVVEFLLLLTTSECVHLASKWSASKFGLGASLLAPPPRVLEPRHASEIPGVTASPREHPPRQAPLSMRALVRRHVGALLRLRDRAPYIGVESRSSGRTTRVVGYAQPSAAQVAADRVSTPEAGDTHTPASPSMQASKRRRRRHRHRRRRRSCSDETSARPASPAPCAPAQSMPAPAPAPPSAPAQSMLAPAPALPSADLIRPVEQLRLYFELDNGDVTSIKLLSTTPFLRAIASYCSRRGISVETMKFSFDGIRIQGYDTPDSLDMVDGDRVYATPCFYERAPP